MTSSPLPPSRLSKAPPPEMTSLPFKPEITLVKLLPVNASAKFDPSMSSTNWIVSPSASPPVALVCAPLAPSVTVTPADDALISNPVGVYRRRRCRRCRRRRRGNRKSSPPLSVSLPAPPNSAIGVGVPRKCHRRRCRGSCRRCCRRRYRPCRLQSEQQIAAVAPGDGVITRCADDHIIAGRPWKRRHSCLRAACRRSAARWRCLRPLIAKCA